MNSDTDPWHGPHPGPIALVSLVLLVGSLVAMSALSGGLTISDPLGETTQVVRIFREHPLAVRVAATLQLGSAIPLGIFAAVAYARLRFLGVRVPGPAIALFGGILASALLAVSGTITWTQSQPPVVADPRVLHVLALLAFATGGVAHVLGLGLLVAGLAVPALLLGLLPRGLTWAGLVVAAAAELAVLALLVEPLQFLIPLGRFGSLLWLVAAGFLLVRTRPRRPANDPQVAAS